MQDTGYFVHPDYSPQPEQELLFMLHGYGSNEVDLYMLKEYLPEKYYPVSLRAPLRTPYGGYAWYPIYVNSENNLSVDEKEMKQAAFDLKKRMDAIAGKFNRKKPYNLLGFSQGSIISYVLLSFFPADFNKITAFSGYIHEPAMNPDFTKAETVNVYASHGLYDDLIPVEWAKKIPGYLKSKHIPFTFRLFPTGHYLSEENIFDAVEMLRK